MEQNMQSQSGGISQEDKDQILNGNIHVRKYMSKLTYLELKEYVDTRIMEVMEEFTEKYEKEVDFLMKQVGILKCEQELQKAVEKQQKLEPYLQDIPEDQTDSFHFNIKIANLEQALNLHNLDAFNKENTSRLEQLFETLEEQVQVLT